MDPQPDTATPPVTAAPRTGSRQYWAFISYSHADEAWARWLHSSLEKYQVPRRLVGRPHPFGRVPRDLRPVFRDRDDLVSSPELSTAIHQALASSRELIVICSPSAAASPYVNKEVRQFKSLGRGDHIRCLIVDGQPAAGRSDCFPPALRSRGAGTSETAPPIEPLAADVRPDKDGRRQALLKILAGILDVPYDELRRREQRRNRQRRAIAAVSLAALLAILLVVLSDAGLNLPYSEPIRVRLDRAGISLFRPVLEPRQIVEAAARLRPLLVATLRERRRESGMYSWSPKRDVGADTWSSAQVLGVLSRTPETAVSEWPQLRQTIDRLFSEPYFLRAGERPEGWMFRAGRPPNGNVALWVVAALAEILSRKGFVPDADRPAIMAHYTSALQVASQLSPLDDGGWNMFASQDEPVDHNYYTGTLALQALIGADTAGLPWVDGQPVLPRLSQTARWLVAGFDGAAETAGWRRSAIDKDTVQDGLTLQAYALLLRAEELDAVALPDYLVTQMTRHLVSLVDRGRGFPASSAEFNATVKGTEESEGIVLLWYPWAIGASDLWLRRSDRLGAAAEDVRRVRRSLGHLIVNHGGGIAATHEEEETFRAAELLWNLAQIGG